MKILSVESSAVSVGAALTQDGRLLGESFSNIRLTHSQTLLPMVYSLLENTRTQIEQIDVFAVSNGPGSFTGVRIGVSAIKGLAHGAGKPCFAVSTTEAIAYPFQDFAGVVCAVMDARCNQVYTALFDKGERLSEDAAIQIDELKIQLEKYGQVLFAGDGALLCYEALHDVLPGAVLAPPQMRFQHASSVAFLAEEKIAAGEMSVDPQVLLPKYLRLPQAQRELNNLKKGN